MHTWCASLLTDAACKVCLTEYCFGKCTDNTYPPLEARRVRGSALELQARQSDLNATAEAVSEYLHDNGVDIHDTDLNVLRDQLAMGDEAAELVELYLDETLADTAYDFLTGVQCTDEDWAFFSERMIQST